MLLSVGTVQPNVDDKHQTLFQINISWVGNIYIISHQPLSFYTYFFKCAASDANTWNVNCGEKNPLSSWPLEGGDDSAPSQEGKEIAPELSELVFLQNTI